MLHSCDATGVSDVRAGNANVFQVGEFARSSSNGPPSRSEHDVCSPGLHKGLNDGHTTAWRGPGPSPTGPPGCALPFSIGYRAVKVPPPVQSQCYVHASSCAVVHIDLPYFRGPFHRHAGQNKQFRFAEKPRSHVVQPTFAELMEAASPLRGRWNSDFSSGMLLVLELGCGRGGIGLSRLEPQHNHLGSTSRAHASGGCPYGVKEEGLCPLPASCARAGPLDQGQFAPGEVDAIWPPSAIRSCGKPANHASCSWTLPRVLKPEAWCT